MERIDSAHGTVSIPTAGLEYARRMHTFEWMELNQPNRLSVLYIKSCYLTND